MRGWGYRGSEQWAVGSGRGDGPGPREQQRGKTRANGQILTGSPLGPCSPLKPAIPGSPLTKETGRFSHWVLSAHPAPIPRNPKGAGQRTRV